MADNRFTVRFAVTKNGKIGSSVWRIWKARKTDDIYIAPKPIAGQIKLSLHANRYCHLAMTKESQGGNPGPRPIVTSWTRPNSEPEAGWVDAVSILIAPELLEPTEDELDPDTMFIETPPPGQAVIASLIFSRLPAGAITLPPASCELGHVPLKSGEHFAVLAGYFPFDYARFLQNFNVAPRDAKVTAFGPVEQANRVALFNDPNAEGGSLRIVDAALSRSTPGQA